MENTKRDRYCHPFGGKKAATTTTWAHTPPRLRLLTALLLAAFAAAPVAAQDGSTSWARWWLRARRKAQSRAPSRCWARMPSKRNADTVGSAVVALPGASLSRNSRNEDTVYLRGLIRAECRCLSMACRCMCLTTAMWTLGGSPRLIWPGIRVATSGASLLYGPNTLGGADQPRHAQARARF